MDVIKRPHPPGIACAARFPFAIAACIALFACAWQASAREGPAPPSSGIAAVWNAQTSCSGFVSIAKARHPDEASIRATGRVDLPAAGFTFAYAGLDGMDDMVLLLAFDDRSRGVVDHYVLLAPDDLSPPVAAIVITELPSDLQADPRSFLLSVAAQQLGNARDFLRHPVMFSHLMGETSGPGLELLVPGRTGSFCFPTARFLIDRDDRAPTLGISWFVVDGPYLFEYALLVPSGEPHLAQDRIDLARAQMLRLTGSVHRTKDVPPG